MYLKFLAAVALLLPIDGEGNFNDPAPDDLTVGELAARNGSEFAYGLAVDEEVAPLGEAWMEIDSFQSDVLCMTYSINGGDDVAAAAEAIAVTQALSGTLGMMETNALMARLLIRGIPDNGETDYGLEKVSDGDANVLGLQGVDPVSTLTRTGLYNSAKADFDEAKQRLQTLSIIADLLQQTIQAAHLEWLEAFHEANPDDAGDDDDTGEGDDEEEGE